jgi:hypothetical protein
VGSQYGSVAVQFQEIFGSGIELSMRGEERVFRGGFGISTGFFGLVFVVKLW